MSVGSWDYEKTKHQSHESEYRQYSDGDGDVDSRIEVQLEEDGGGRTERSWIEKKWSVAYVPPSESDKAEVKEVKSINIDTIAAADMTGRYVNRLQSIHSMLA